MIRILTKFLSPKTKYYYSEKPGFAELDAEQLKLNENISAIKAELGALLYRGEIIGVSDRMIELQEKKYKYKIKLAKVEEKIRSEYEHFD